MTPDRENVTLKCLSCATLMRLPRDKVADIDPLPRPRPNESI
jgi:hypothetical protein